MESEKGLFVKIIAVVIIVSLGFFFVKNTLFERETKSLEEYVPVGRDDLTGGASVQAEVVNGVQEVTLSWGKFNYNPQEIIVKKDIPVKLRGDMQRLQGCFRSVVIPEFGVTKVFTEANPLLEFTPTKTGVFKFSCSMGMGEGTLRVI